jgi:hypothetical protein
MERSSADCDGDTEPVEAGQVELEPRAGVHTEGDGIGIGTAQWPVKPNGRNRFGEVDFEETAFAFDRPTLVG